MPPRRLSRPADEQQRLAELRSYRLDGPSPEAEFDHIVRLAADLFEVPTALVSFVEEEHQFFKARVGFAACETSRDVSFCTYTLVGDDLLVVPDARADARFADNPLVTGEPFVRFYAGAAIVTPKGRRLGAVCIADTVPRPPLTGRQSDLLRSLARIVMDHLERRRLDTVRHAAMKMAAAIPDAIVCSDEAGAITFWNVAAERMFGLSRRQALGMSLARLVPPDHLADYGAWMAGLIAAGGQRPSSDTLDVRALRRDGTEFPIEISVATWRDGSRVQVGSIIRDVSERDRAQDRMRYLTHFDRLTDLPNRVQFLEKIDEALTTIGRFTVLKIGLDRFKVVNGTMGMAAGDLVLAAAARRVRGAAGSGGFVARLGADEFGVLVVGNDDPLAADALARRIVALLGEPFPIGGSPCHLGASIGIVLCPGLSHFEAADGVLKGALLALQVAKAAGGRRSELFRSRLGRQADERREIETELRAAFKGDEFELHFQPQVEIADGRIVGAEALLRWRHPRRGLLAPASFLSILETSELALPVGRWIVRRACAFAAGMAARGNPVRMGVNLFAAQLRDAGFHDDVTAALAEAGLPPDRLEIEITETTVLGLDETVIDPLRRLRTLGVGIAFDDYGTGYASLSLLKRYPLTRLKIDREFVRDLDHGGDDAAIVKAVLAMGASLGLDVIAEGIETSGQAAALVALGCREAQGYLFGRPMPAREFVLLATGRPVTAAA